MTARARAACILLAACALACTSNESEADMSRLGDWLRPFFPRPTAIVAEPVKGPWKNNPQWGNSFDGPIPVQANQEIPIFEAGELVGPPRVQSLILFRNQAAAGANADVRARVTYGIGAKQDSFDLDYLNGSQFTLVANYVRVTAVSYAPEPLNPYDGGGGTVQLGAGIAEGTVCKGLPASFTESIRTSVVSPVAIFEAPAFAKAVIVWGGAPAFTVQIIGGGSLNPFTGTIADFDPFRDVGMALPGGTVRVIVNSGGADATVTVQWLLGM